MDLNYKKSKDCRGGKREMQEHDQMYNARLQKRRAKEKRAKEARKKNRGE